MLLKDNVKFKYYLKKFKWEQKPYIKFLEEITKYHYQYGEQGFLSEKTYLADLPEMAKRVYERNQQLKSVNLAIEKIILNNDDTDKSAIEKIESQDTFIKWITTGNILYVD